MSARGMMTFYEWGAVALAVVGIVGVVLAPTRLGAIIALGVQGLALALLFLFFGAPDLGFTQLLVEVLSVVVLALVMARLHLSVRDTRPLEDWLRDGTLALICGAAVSLLLLRVLQGTFDGRLSAFFEANSAAIAHGRNIVNVILVDFRGLDTLGEISVVMTAGIGVLALLRRQHKRERSAAESGGSMSTLIFRTTAPAIAGLMVLFSIAVLLRGHNDPGGGFIAGLIVASAAAVIGMSHGVGTVRRLLRINPIVFAGLGVLLAVVGGLLSVPVGDPFLTGLWLPANLFGTPGLFDIGVYLVVFGAITAVALALEDGGEAP